MALHWVSSPTSPTPLLRDVAHGKRGYLDLTTSTVWPSVQPIADGHPDPAVDAQLSEAYRAREIARRGPVLEEVVQRRGIMAFFRRGGA